MPGDRLEVPVDGFVIDLVRDDLLIEIQTGGFAPMKPKLTSLIERDHRVRVVHSIPIDNWIVKVDDEGTILGRRRSPKHGKPTDIFTKLVSFPELLDHPNMEVDVLLTHEEERRKHMPGRAWRRQGWIVAERQLIEVVDSMLLAGVEDLADLLPGTVPETFTTADIAESLGTARRTAQQMAYCLLRAGVLRVVGKRGNTIQYRRSD
jgi:hypothetical protein